MTFVRRKPKWNWRNFLTQDEKDALEKADRAKAEWLALNTSRAGIINRAIQRAKAEAIKAEKSA